MHLVRRDLQTTDALQELLSSGGAITTMLHGFARGVAGFDSLGLPSHHHSLHRSQSARQCACSRRCLAYPGAVGLAAASRGPGMPLRHHVARRMLFILPHLCYSCVIHCPSILGSQGHPLHGMLLPAPRWHRHDHCAFSVARVCRPRCWPASCRCQRTSSRAHSVGPASLGSCRCVQVCGVSAADVYASCLLVLRPRCCRDM